ncbi:MAG: tetratricopeptide repeat protein, partial [Okeania sp. SIO2F4]|uniref:tetratricopeptide repeat protein n=1 Tax=Okeania sp. SIO2F4 TaxID=2607790 RepID=UPI00142A2818
MNKEQFQARLNLINQLLTCPNAEEQATLHANSHLVDEAFVEVMKLVAAKMPEDVESNAEWLQSFAKQLAEMMEEWKQLNEQATELYNTGKYDEAIPIVKQVETLALELWGESHANVATSLNNLAELYHSQGRYSEAEPLFKQAIEIVKISLPVNHPYLASSLNNLAELYKSQGRYSEVEPLYQQAIEIVKISLPVNHPYLATLLNNLALLYRFQWKYSEAEPLFKQAIEIDKIALPANHPDLAINLNNLAELYESQGRYSEAEPLYQQAIEIDKIALPANHPGCATHLNNLAGLYYYQGRYSEAEPLYQQAIEIDKIALPPNHPERATRLNNLANLYRYQGRCSEAETLCQQVIEIDKIALPPNHPGRATHLNNLALLYQSQGRYSEAEPLYQQAIEIDKIALPPNHPERATRLNNLANLYKSLGRYSEAEPLYQQAIEIVKIALPANHPDLANHLNHLALLLAKTDRPKEAFKLMLKASNIQDKTIQVIFASSSESDRLAHIQKEVRPALEAFLSLVYQYLPHSQAAKQAALNLVLKRKALTATALAAQNQAVFSGRYPQLQEIFSQWRQKCDQLLAFTYQVPPLEKREVHKQQLAQLQKECNELERQLAREVPEIAMQEQMGDRRAVALELPEGAKLLEFVRFRVVDFQNNSWQKARYLAFVLAAGKPSDVEMIDLGQAENIDRLISVYRESVMELPEVSVEVPVESGRSPQPPLVRGAKMEREFRSKSNSNSVHSFPSSQEGSQNSS